MSEPLARLYDLALRALDDQERRVDALRGRLAPIVAAAALGVTLLSGPLVGGEHPTNLLGALALLAALGGLLVTVAAAFRMLSAPQPLPLPDAQRLIDDLLAAGHLSDERRFYMAMIEHFGEYAEQAHGALRRLMQAFTGALCGILVMLCGLSLAAIVG